MNKEMTTSKKDQEEQRLFTPKTPPAKVRGTLGYHIAMLCHIPFPSESGQLQGVDV
jgi:hypothetical protein